MKLKSETRSLGDFAKEAPKGHLNRIILYTMESSFYDGSVEKEYDGSDQFKRAFELKVKEYESILQLVDPSSKQNDRYLIKLERKTKIYKDVNPRIANALKRSTEICGSKTFHSLYRADKYKDCMFFKLINTS